MRALRIAQEKGQRLRFGVAQQNSCQLKAGIAGDTYHRNVS
jgi:hypothetical protein